MYQKFERKHWDIFSIYIIPLFTIVLASTDGWVASNLSVIAYSNDKQIAFLIWGLLSAWYFNAYLWYQFRRVNYNGKVGIAFLQAATLSLIFAVATPYVPDQFPQKSTFHIIFAFFSPLLLLVSIFCYQVYLEKVSKVIFKPARLELAIMVIVSFVILMIVGFVSSLLEIFVSISVCYYLRTTHKRIEVYRSSVS